MSKRAEQIDFEQAVYKAFGQVKDFTLATRIAKYFYEQAEKDLREVVASHIERNWIDGYEEGFRAGVESCLPINRLKRLFKKGVRIPITSEHRNSDKKVDYTYSQHNRNKSDDL